MFQILVNRNDDIKRLVEKGYAVAFDTSCMIVRDIPYLDNQKGLQMGAIVTKLVFIDQEQVKQDDHQIFFAGSIPHNIDGTPIPHLAGGPTQFALSDACKDVVVERSFSNKPRVNGELKPFNDLFEKIESYVTIISGPAMALHGANPYTFRTVETMPESVFKFHDTLTSRAEITDLSAKFKDDVIAIVGLGGTGAYILDFLVKTSVKEIRAFDPDMFYIHNAFRSPGKVDETEFNKAKAEIYRSRYDNFRTGLIIERQFIDASSGNLFDGVTFAFVCVDKGSSRDEILKLLISKGVPFIDVGMGLNRKRGPINGMLRTTHYSTEDGQKIYEKGLAPILDTPDNIYKTNIQISELNALNASLAVIRFKQLRGFYLEDIANYNLLFEIGDLKVVGEAEL